MIEDVLYGLNTVSLLIGITYEPDVSLAESFANIKTSLDSVPQTLAEISLPDTFGRTQINTDFTDFFLVFVFGGSLNGCELFFRHNSGRGLEKSFNKICIYL